MDMTTIDKIDIGTAVQVQEDGATVNYILTRKDTTSVELLREKCYSARRMNPQNTTVYEGSEMDAWLIDESAGFLSLFSSALKSNLVSKAISTFTYGDTEYHYIYRKCFLYSYGDMFMTTPDALYPEVKAFFPLMINKGTLDQNVCRVATDNNNNAVNWWLRSPYSATQFRSVNNSGGAGSSSASNAGLWCRPVLSVSPDTVAGIDSGGQVALLPEEKPRVVEFEGKLSEFAQVPKYGCIQVSSHNLGSLAFAATNNYGDSTPVWQTVQNGVQFEFENTTKTTTNYEVGIRCYGVAPTGETGYFEQPQMLVEV